MRRTKMPSGRYFFSGKQMREAKWSLSVYLSRIKRKEITEVGAIRQFPCGCGCGLFTSICHD